MSKKFKLTELPMGLQEMFRLYWQTEEATPEQRALPHEEAVEAFLQWCRNPENFNWKNGGESQRWLMENGYSPTLTITTMDAKTVKLLEAKIHKAMVEYLHENIMTAHQLSDGAWMEIYHNAGLSDQEIAEYEKATQPTPEQLRALDDKVSEYNS